ncbi:hypothetical protein ACFFHH_15190 [Cytobacillus solani]|uniref:hypothetical protein n=1 Tax=Cytobacillus solani TaxID=1637975 RepID=UPI0006ABAACC|nr:hypothetical protein [Cytobacillus solani]KOP81338.1 hypothetical protein AMS60_01830 [Bacillus sp. FJAT-21945]
MNYKKIISFLFALILLFSLFFLVTKNESASVANFDNEELSLKEAIILGLNKAKDWNQDATLFNVTSVDEDMGGTRGEGGKRYDWTLNFIVPGTDKHLLVGISKGVIFNQREVDGPKDTIPMELDNIEFDSPELLNIAKEKFDLRKGEDWATGYHFTLDNIDDKPTVTVFGTDKDNLFTRININPKTGKIEGAIHKVPEGGGLITKLGSNSPKISNLGMAVNGISVNDSNLVTWGYRKPRTFNTKIQPFIELSKNRGQSWDALNINQNIVNAWFNTNSELYVATESEIWSNVTFEDKKKTILKAKIDHIDYSQNNNIAVSSENFIYTTLNNGERWDKIVIPEAILLHQISNDGDLIILTNDRKLLYKKGEEWETLKIPTNPETITDMKVFGNELILAMGDSLGVYNLDTANLNEIQMNDPINTLIKKKNNLFGITKENTIYTINLGGDANRLVMKKLIDMEDQVITDMEVIENDLIMATTPNYYWEEIY